MTSKGKLPIIELPASDRTGNVSIDHRELSKQIIEALEWVSERYGVPQPKVLPANGMLSAGGILLDGMFILGREKKSERWKQSYCFPESRESPFYGSYSTSSGTTANTCAL